MRETIHWMPRGIGTHTHPPQTKNLTPEELLKEQARLDWDAAASLRLAAEYRNFMAANDPLSNPSLDRRAAAWHERQARYYQKLRDGQELTGDEVIDAAALY